MKVLFDTSILIAALIDSHPNHSVCFPWLAKAKDSKIEGFISTHTLAELYAILTSLPVQRKATTSEIWQLIKESVLANFEIVELTNSDYTDILESLANNRIRGGSTYDALIAQAAFKAKVDKLLTLNTKHFKRVCSQVSHLIDSPN